MMPSDGCQASRSFVDLTAIIHAAAGQNDGDFFAETKKNDETKFSSSLKLS